MMNTLLNVIVAAALVLTFAFASELGPGSRSDAQRAVVFLPADAGPTTAASYNTDKNKMAD